MTITVAAAGDIVGLKSIAAYYSGLDIDTKVTKKEAEEGLQQVLAGEFRMKRNSYMSQDQINSV